MRYTRLDLTLETFLRIAMRVRFIGPKYIDGVVPVKFPKIRDRKIGRVIRQIRRMEKLK